MGSNYHFVIVEYFWKCTATESWLRKLGSLLTTTNEAHIEKEKANLITRFNIEKQQKALKY